MTGYSERSHELARELAAKAARNLSRSGETVRLDATGRYVVEGRNGSVDDRGGQNRKIGR